MSKQRKRRSKSNAVSKDTRQVSAKQAAKKSTKARQRITKEQAADVTARLNNEFAAVHMLSEKLRLPGTITASPWPVPEGTIQELADVMQTL